MVWIDHFEAKKLTWKFDQEIWKHNKDNVTLYPKNCALLGQLLSKNVERSQKGKEMNVHKKAKKGNFVQHWTTQP